MIHFKSYILVHSWLHSICFNRYQTNYINLRTHVLGQYQSSHSISHVVWPGLDLQCVLCSSLSSLSSWQEHYRSKERNIHSDTVSVVIVRVGSKCSVKAYKFCRLQGECRRGECLNTNRREPRRRTERRKYCANVSCDSPCVCPQDLDPVCDQDGNKVTSKQGWKSSSCE